MSKRVKHDRRTPQLPTHNPLEADKLTTHNSQLTTEPRFTLVELLTVIGIIAILAAMLMPALSSARRKVREGAVKTEIQNLEVAMTSYYRDWGAYPPDDVDLDGNGIDEKTSAQCLVHYLGTKFRTSDGFTKNGGPYFEFETERLVEHNGYDIYVDHFGKGGRDVYYYRFDNNEADDGDAPTGNYENLTNVHPSSVDIWSAGEDGEDDISSAQPEQDDLKKDQIGDDIGNW